ncbi:hypothetical protein GGX14DRAFT_538347 [Mycena pura]|uniref:HNH nuclease domain-containing protein n=1 Tax=Mycena pura TaxID=153505 RepID=A0AAD6YVL9_9AGAR|nr:hypothetical protein GGX14DRAFT_538347 [Mycena pura]
MDNVSQWNTPPEVSADIRHEHILSDKSKELQRDTFFFAPMGPHPIRLILGLNQQLTPVSVSTLRRWVHVMKGYPQEFCLFPVKVEPYGIMTYSMSPSGPMIDPESTESLPPGNYGWYKDSDLTPHSFLDLTGVDMAMRDKSFEYNVTFMDDERLLNLYKFPSDVEHRVLTRDSRRCEVTGSTDDLVLTWIVPPPWAWAAVNIHDPPEIAPTASAAPNMAIHPLGFDPSPFLVPANAILLRKDLKVHFYNHHFTIDADDNYRVIVLRDMGDTQQLLPTHLPRHPEHDNSDALFFRLHLRYSFNFMLLGGDIREKYPPHRILSMMHSLGVTVGGDDPDCEMAALDDDRWQTELGQAILTNVMDVRASLNQYASDSDEESDGEDDLAPVWEKDGPYTIDWNAHLPRPTSPTDLSITDKDHEKLDVEDKKKNGSRMNTVVSSIEPEKQPSIRKPATTLESGPKEIGLDKPTPIAALH